MSKLDPVPLGHLGSEALLVHLAHGQHHVGVRIVFFPMHVEVGHHPARHEFALHELPRQRDAFGLAQLLRDGELDFTRHLRVLALLAEFNRVPQLRTIGHPRRRTLGQDDLRMHHVGLIAVVEALALALVVQLAGRAVGRRRHRAAPLAAADDLGL